VSPCLSHPPIAIDGNASDEGFLLTRENRTGTPVYRPGSGVVAGSGTAEDPYRIEDWCIREVPNPVGNGGPNVGVRIANTSAHVLARNVTVDGTTDGIELVNADNVTLAGTELRRLPGTGVRAERSGSLVLEDNEVQAVQAGIEVRSGSGIELAGNAIRDVESTGVVISDVARVKARDNVVRNVSRGVGIENAEQVRLVTNAITATREDSPGAPFVGSSGLGMVGVTNATIRENRFVDNAGNALELGAVRGLVTGNAIVDPEDSGIRSLPLGVPGVFFPPPVPVDRELRIEHNRIAGATLGIGVGWMDTVRVANNTVAVRDIADTGSNVAVGLSNVNEATVRGNNFQTAAVGGLTSAWTPDVDAANNWWGHASGPSGGVEDACTDAIADGEGAEIVLDGDASVCFDPWRSAPNPAAGPR
jgi:hypothetical protein